MAELLCLDSELRDLIVSRAPMSALQAAARRRGQPTLRDAALAAVRAGQTTLEEVARVVGSD